MTAKNDYAYFKVPCNIERLSFSLGYSSALTYTQLLNFLVDCRVLAALSLVRIENSSSVIT